MKRISENGRIIWNGIDETGRIRHFNNLILEDGRRITGPPFIIYELTLVDNPLDIKLISKNKELSLVL